MTSPSNKVVFMTGSTGFIGSRVVEILCRDGWQVRALVRDVAKAKNMFESRQPSTPGSIEYIQEDLFAGTPADRTKTFAECLAGANAAIHIAEAKMKEKDFDAKNIKAFGLLLEAAAGTPGLERVRLCFGVYGRRASSTDPQDFDRGNDGSRVSGSLFSVEENR